MAAPKHFGAQQIDFIFTCCRFKAFLPWEWSKVPSGSTRQFQLPRDDGVDVQKDLGQIERRRLYQVLVPAVCKIAENKLKL